MTDTIRVKSKGTDGKVLLFERDKRHPGGEAFLSSDGKVREVAETAAVSRLVGEGVLVRIDESASPTAKENKGKKVTELRPATEEEEDVAGLEGSVEKQTAVTPAKVKLSEIR